MRLNLYICILAVIMMSGCVSSSNIGTSKSDYGFMPIVQHANSLYGIYPDTNEGSCYHLVRYRFR